MNARGWWKTVACLGALVLVSGLLGGLLARRLTRIEFECRSDPRHWNETVMGDMERIVKPTTEQRQKIQGHLDAAVEELLQVRTETIRRSVAVVTRLIEQVDQELTPEQQMVFRRMKPRSSDLSNLNLLNVETRKKAK